MDATSHVDLMQSLFRFLLRGALAGAGILGAGGRLAMTTFSLITGSPLGFTLRGTAAVVVTGALYGLPGAALCWALGRYTRLRPLPQAVLGGTALFVVIAAVSIPNNQADAALERPILSALLFLPLTIAFAAAVRRAPARAMS
ncbi:MAG: hypothetical protein HY337_07690 [Gemmatimonadetes bacterium]|nr:hypothetical protein [Gemmatimonadota bacterium]